MVIGAMAEQVKKTEIAINPGIKDTADILRPKAKARNIAAGKYYTHQHNRAFGVVNFHILFDDSPGTDYLVKGSKTTYHGFFPPSA
jgi:hypothetical protein